jgi:tRNA C32,U32 (ribose-2'-O)-methylase TrmJ
MTGQPAAAAQDPPAPVIVLVRPQLGENVGAAARAMLNFGLTDLRLVQPQCGWPNAALQASGDGSAQPLSVFESLEMRRAICIVCTPPLPRAICQNLWSRRRR